MSFDPVRKISENAAVAKAEPEPVEQQTVVGNSTGNPYGVFPELVWLKISSKIQDTCDWLNVYFASPNLMDLLQNDMIERVFPHVFSHLHKYLSRKDVINLCAADRKFETAIISWGQTRWLAPRWAGEGYDDHNYYKYYASMISAYSPIVCVISREEIQIITNELLKGDSRSMIPFGIVFLQLYRDLQFWPAVKTFLQLFGTCIWFCKLIHDYDGYFPDAIIECLKLMPNVIRLKLRITVPTLPIHWRRFPHLVKLKVLSLVQTTHETFMGFLRIHANQLEYLSIVGKHDPEESFEYSNLKKLCLKDFFMLGGPLKLDLFSQAPVTKIYTTIFTLGFAQFGRAFLKFNKFGASLEDLELHVIVVPNNFRNREENDMTWAVNINLPKLKRLTLWGYGAGEALVLRIHSFQDTHFPYPNYETLLSEREGERINQIFDSDIWSILPNLEEVKCCDFYIQEKTYGIYTRDEYNEYHEKLPNE